MRNRWIVFRRIVFAFFVFLRFLGGSESGSKGRERGKGSRGQLAGRSVSGESGENGGEVGGLVRHAGE